MYEAFFGLDERPFSLTPNPRYVFYSDRYRNALEQLRFGIEQREGFMMLTGVVGAGKTTLSRDLLEHLDGAGHYRTALIFNPFLSPDEMLQSLLSEFGCSYPPQASKKDLLDRLNTFLLAQLVHGYTCVVLFDEAQHLTEAFLEQIRVLSNLETEEEKLLQIVLVGQPELRDRIQKPSLAQLDQRVAVRCTLSHLSEDETERYLYHRVNVAGGKGGVTFSPRAIRLIHRESEGIPRLVNLAADRSLLAAYVDRAETVKKVHVQRGLAALRGAESPEEQLEAGPGPGRWKKAVVVAAIVVLLTLVGVAAYLYANGMLP
jgi:general secretion pathway protein A